MDLFGFHTLDFLVIGVIAYLLLGPEKMTSVLRTARHAYGEIQALRSEFSGELQATLRDIQAPADEVRQSLQSVVDSTRDVMGDAAGELRAIGSPTPSVLTTTTSALRSPIVDASPARPVATKADPLADLAIFGETPANQT
jgi:sec-independent protein translocase protein TatB